MRLERAVDGLLFSNTVYPKETLLPIKMEIKLVLKAASRDTVFLDQMIFDCMSSKLESSK